MDSRAVTISGGGARLGNDEWRCLFSFGLTWVTVALLLQVLRQVKPTRQIDGYEF